MAGERSDRKAIGDQDERQVAGGGWRVASKEEDFSLEVREGGALRTRREHSFAH